MLHKLIEAILQVNSSSINLSLFPLHWKLFDDVTDITEDLISVPYIAFPANLFTVTNNAVINNAVLEFGNVEYSFSGVLTFKLYDSEGTLWFSVSSNISVLESAELSLPASSFNVTLATSDWLGSRLLSIIFKQTVLTLPSFYKLQLYKSDLTTFGTAFELAPAVWSYAVLASDGNYEIVYGDSLFRATATKEKLGSAKILTNTNQLVADLSTFSYFYTFINNVLDIEVRNISIVIGSHPESASLFESSSNYQCYLDFDYNYFDRSKNLALSEIAGEFNSVLKQSGITAVELDAEQLQYTDLSLENNFYMYLEFRLKNSFSNASIVSIPSLLTVSTVSSSLQISFKEDILASLPVLPNVSYKLVIYKVASDLIYMLNSLSDTVNLLSSTIDTGLNYSLIFSNQVLISKFYISNNVFNTNIDKYSIHSFNSRVLKTNSLEAVLKYL